MFGISEELWILSLLQVFITVFSSFKKGAFPPTSTTLPLSHSSITCFPDLKEIPHNSNFLCNPSNTCSEKQLSLVCLKCLIRKEKSILKHWLKTLLDSRKDRILPVLRNEPSLQRDYTVQWFFYFIVQCWQSFEKKNRGRQSWDNAYSYLKVTHSFLDFCQKIKAFYIYIYTCLRTVFKSDK